MLRYDLIFSLGPACSCTQSIRGAGLQHLSFPFDWIGPEYGRTGWDDDVRRRAELVADGFRDWLNPGDFTYRGEHTNGKANFFNDRLGLIFLHDFPPGGDLTRSFDAVREKYDRRVSRLLQLIRASKRVLLVRLDRPDLGPHTKIEDCRFARRRLAEAFPGVRFDLLLLQRDESVAFADRRLETVEDGLMRLAFDYRATDPNADRRQPDFALTSAALADLLSVRDYRTPEERRKHRLALRRKRWARYGATSALGYLWKRISRPFMRGRDATPA